MIQSLEQQLQNALQELEMCREQLQAGSLASKKVLQESQNADLAASQTAELELWGRVEALETEVAQKESRQESRHSLVQKAAKQRLMLESQNRDLGASQQTELELWARVEALETEVAQKDCAMSQLTEELQNKEIDKAKMAEVMQSKMKEAEGRLGTSLFNEESNSATIAEMEDLRQGDKAKCTMMQEQIRLMNEELMQSQLTALSPPSSPTSADMLSRVKNKEQGKLIEFHKEQAKMLQSELLRVNTELMHKIELQNRFKDRIEELEQELTSSRREIHEAPSTTQAESTDGSRPQELQKSRCRIVELQGKVDEYRKQNLEDQIFLAKVLQAGYKVD